MVDSKSINFLVVLALLSFAKGDNFTPLSDWILTIDSIAPLPSVFWNGDGSIGIAADPYAQIVTGCASANLNSQTWSLKSDYSSKIYTNGFAVGFWVNFESTKSDKVFQFGDANDGHYVVKSDKDGSLVVSYYLAGTSDSYNDLQVTVPLSNFHIDKWIFLTFYFVKSNNVVTLNVLLPGNAMLSKQSVANSATPFTIPNGLLYFGKGIKAKFYEVVLTKSASISADFKTITLSDGTNTRDIAKPCTAGSDGDPCPDSCTYDNQCLASKMHCTYCASGSCSACDADSARDKSKYCQSCQSGNTMKNFHCCDNTKNCAGCSVKSTVCDLCNTKWFLYDESATSTVCYSCDDSCSSCNPGPECYNCADAVTQNGASCRVDSLGFQVSVDNTNIILDFAHNLPTGLAKGTFKATSISTADIPTTTWALNDCKAGAKTCTIAAPNLKESDLPVTLEFDFTQVNA